MHTGKFTRACRVHICILTARVHMCTLAGSHTWALHMHVHADTHTHTLSLFLPNSQSSEEGGASFKQPARKGNHMIYQTPHIPGVGQTLSKGCMWPPLNPNIWLSL